MGKCSVQGCDRPSRSHGLCAMHNARRLKGIPLQQKESKKRPMRDRRVTDYPEYNSYRSMFDRCNNPCNKWYADYGGRGIKICDRWLHKDGFWIFLEDMGRKPSYHTGATGRAIYSLDRIDVNGDYCPENCRWANHSQQMNNTRANRRFMAFGKKGTFTELFRFFAPDGLKKKTAERRFYEMGWPIEQAITALPQGRR